MASKLLPLLLLTLATSSCSWLTKTVYVTDPAVPPPVRAADDMRCWLQDNYGEMPLSGHIWLSEQQKQERSLRGYWGLPLDLPPAKCFSERVD